MIDLRHKTPKELQVQLGDRIKQLRLRQNLDQRETAALAGVSERALRNLEMGRGSTVETFIRALKALNLIDGLDVLVPESSVDPLAVLKSTSKQRRVYRSLKTRTNGDR
jgi:transcriptional regulator with XRE-family HTH domain